VLEESHKQKSSESEINMKETSPWHDTKREANTLRIEQKVYHFKGKKTTNTKTLDKWLRDEYDVLPNSLPYGKLEAVEVQRKTFEEVESDE
jgi:hypothetical protein